MDLPARVALITLACRNVGRMTRLFRDLGWPETIGAASSLVERRI